MIHSLGSISVFYNSEWPQPRTCVRGYLSRQLALGWAQATEGVCPALWRQALAEVRHGSKALGMVPLWGRHTLPEVTVLISPTGDKDLTQLPRIQEEEPVVGLEGA